MKADRWGNQWSKNGVLLRFGSSTTATMMALDPVAAKHLYLSLMQTMHQHETSFGISWSEHDIQCGAISDAHLQRSEISTSNAFAHALYLLIKNLPLNGYERSFKMAAETLWDERFLVGISMDLIAPEDVAFLMEKMDVPAVFFSDIRTQLTAANFMHIGFEQGQVSTYKFYLEFPVDHKNGKPTPLYLGYKWNAENTEQNAISRYTQPQALNLPQLLEKVDAMYGDAKENNVVRKIAKSVITLAASNVDTSELRFVEVEEESSKRMSFDINLYETGMTVRNLQPMLFELCEHFAIDEEKFGELMARTVDDLVGHLSGGTDRNGNAFLTTYHACVTPGNTETKNV